MEAHDRRGELDMVELLNDWDSFSSDSKARVIDRYLNLVTSIESIYGNALDGVSDQDYCPLLDHVSILKELDLKLSHELNKTRDKTDMLLRECNIRRNTALGKFHEMQLFIWDMLEIEDYVPSSHVKWMEDSVSAFESRDQIEVAIFDAKRCCYGCRWKWKRRSSFYFKLEDYMSLKRKSQKKKFLEETRREYIVLLEKWKHAANKINELSKYLTRKYTKFDIPGFQLRTGNFINRFCFYITKVQ
ncbi:hypothetical protein MKW92_002107 [Papaver armeniacum]|nr:hypothetical protein MKW92_002107 [Papaver armeniacum]